jgi:NAD(P)-dependent dehydrogenase (short-subunit alcohol dehydrogenase family)
VVRAGGRGLHALVNDAGIGTLAPLIEVRDEDFAYQLDVNVHGPFRMVKTFASLPTRSCWLRSPPSSPAETPSLHSSGLPTSGVESSGG